MADYFQILCGIAVVLLSLYYYFTRTFEHWKNLGIAGPRPLIIFGNLKDAALNKIAINDFIKRSYNEYKHEQMFGIFARTEPVLIVNNLDLVKDILIKDFSSFASRGLSIYPKAEPLSQHLFMLEPDSWRPLRARLSPVFTSGKLKDMFALIAECAENLEKYLETVETNNEPVECIDLAAKFTTDVIGSCAFGLEMKSISSTDSEFRRLGKELFKPSPQQRIRDLCREFMPAVYSVFGHLLRNTYIDDFFTGVIRDTMHYRKEKNLFRPDFVNILMEMKEQSEKVGNMELTDTFLTAQAFLFFVAGFETSSTTIGHALYELALHTDIQDKLRREIRESCAKHGRVVTYEQLKEMKYLDKVFRETLRKYPVLAMLMRGATEDYTFRNTKITVPKGTKIWIPVYGIQMDPQIYPKPDVFDPERFEEEAFNARHPMAYLPFGDGPRNCVGARFAHLQSKVGLITILRDYRVDVCEKTTIPFEPEERSFLLKLKGGVMLKISKVGASTS